MPDYKLYMSSKQIAPKDLVHALRPAFGSVNKAHVSFAVHSDDNGLCFRPDAEQLLIAAYGEGPGLMCAAGSGSQPAPRPKPNRRKPHRLVVYVDEPLFQRIQSAAAQQGYVTMQGFLESLLYKIKEENNT